MYLHKLELHGFKSFADHTVVDFAPGVTAIVGPNGCGKSNIVDAVRWVIGEQRARILRSEKMDNVIFNGAARRKPLGMAEVLLTIENTRGILPTEYTEVTIGRRLYRSGESEYLLNGVVCRLKDITDLFMDTGMGAGAYSVIELKMVEDLLSENEEDRRRLFEEAAGVTKYKLRRRQTLHKLDTTQVDLLRLRDVIEELDKQVHSLRRQAHKAARFRELDTRRGELERALAQAEHDRLDAESIQLATALQALRDQLDAGTARLAQTEAALEALRTRQIDQEQALSARQQALNAALELRHRLEADRRLVQERQEANGREQARLAQEQQEAESRREALQQALIHHTEAQAQTQAAHHEARAGLDTVRQSRDAAQMAFDAQRQALHAQRRHEQAALERTETCRRAFDRLASRLEMLDQEQARLHTRYAEDTALAATLEANWKAGAQDVVHTLQALETARAALGAAEALHDQLRQAHEATTSALHQAERQREAATAELHLLESLLSSYEEFTAPVQFLAATPGWTHAPLRTVADVLGCDEAHRVALDTALGTFAACIVVQTEAEAAQAIAHLQATHQGQATFFVLDRLREDARQPQAYEPSERYPLPATIRPLLDLVRVAAPAYQPLAAVLLRDSYLVSSLDEVPETDLPLRFITPVGAWYDYRGFRHDGSDRTGASQAVYRLSRHEQRTSAQADCDRLEAACVLQQQVLQTLQEQILTLRLLDLRAQVQQAEQASTTAERQHARQDYERETLARQQAELEARLVALDATRATDQIEADTLRQQVEAAEAQLSHRRTERLAAEATFQQAETESRHTLNRFNEASIAAVEAQARAENAERDLERTRATLDELHLRTTERTARRTLLEQQQDAGLHTLLTFDAQIEQVRHQCIGLEADTSACHTALLETRAAITEREAEVRELRRERDLALRAENTTAIRLAEVNTHREDLVRHIQEDFGFSLLDEPVSIDPDFDEASARAEVQQLRAALRALGPVNALALDDYEQENTRLTFLQTQLGDLEQAETTLLETIDEINTTASARFNETFAAIRQNFQALFCELFGEDATADVALERPDDPLESPIEITAKPRGKRPITLAQLSGGEKTLTATALLFAIYLVKPSPFCILDEVDAPLDDANITRFMHLIRTFASSTQFILVTHNKRTMEAADRLYGITMQEQGISKLVGVRFEELDVPTPAEAV
jgi:chromosome segregation protein